MNYECCVNTNRMLALLLMLVLPWALQGCVTTGVNPQAKRQVHLRVDSNVAGVPIEIDDEVVGVTPLNGTVDIPDMSRQVSLEIVYDRAVYETEDRTIYYISRSENGVEMDVNFRDYRSALLSEFGPLSQAEKVDIVHVISAYESVYSAPKFMAEQKRVEANSALSTLIIKYPGLKNSEFVRQMKSVSESITSDFAVAEIVGRGAPLGGLRKIGVLKEITGQI